MLHIHYQSGSIIFLWEKKRKVNWVQGQKSRSNQCCQIRDQKKWKGILYRAVSINQRDAVQKKSFLTCILQMKFLFGFELLSSILCFLLLLLISHTERLSSFWSLENFKYLIIAFFFNKRGRREKLLEQWKEILRERWLYYNMFESSWVGVGWGISVSGKNSYLS